MARFLNRLAKSDKLGLCVVFLAALLPRSVSLGAFVTWDEPMWVYRSIRFLSALLHGDFVGTRQGGHPGVIIMICGALGVAVRRFFLDSGAADAAWLNALPSLEPVDVEAMRRLAPFLPMAKVPLVVLHAACIAGMYLLLKRLLGFRTAIVAAILIALDPFHIALSRVLHIDGAASDFMMLSLLVLLFSLYDRNRLVLLSGALAGLAFLSKSYSLFLLPFAALVLGAFGILQGRPLRQAVLAFVGWCLTAGAVFSLLWPAMWVDPVGTVRSVLNTAFGYAAALSGTAEFFWGRVVEAAGPLFYPVAVAFRTTPLVWLGLLTFFVLAVRALWLVLRGTHAWREAVAERWFPAVILLVYICLFCAAISLAAKKFDRYMLPAILALDIVAAMGLTRVAAHWKWNAAWLPLGLALLVQGGSVLSYHPYYFTYYNPLVGGARLAPRVMPLGWGEGMDRAANYFNGKDNAEELTVATGGIPGFAPFFEGRIEPLTQHGLTTSDYTILYVSDIQQHSALFRQFSAQQPEAVIRIHDIDYVWIFPNVEQAKIASFLHSQTASQDAILMDARSPLSRDYPGAACVLDGQTEEEVVAQLRSIATNHQHLWYIHYPEADPKGWINHQLATHALLLGRQSFGQVLVSHYFLPSASSFASAAIRTDEGVRFGKLRLLGYGLDADSVEYRQELGVTLLWQSEGTLAENYALSLRLQDQQGHTWVKEDRWLLDSGGAATSAWAADETIQDRHLLCIPPGIPPGIYELKAILYDAHTLQQLAVLDQAGKAAGTEHSITTVRVVPPSVPPTAQEWSIPRTLQWNFGQLELLGFDLTSEEVSPGQTLELGLFWQALQPIQHDCIQMLTLRDGTGHVWSEATSALANDHYPASQWREGEFLHARSVLPIDVAVPSGTYSLLVNVLCTESEAPLMGGLPLAKLTVRGREHLFTQPAIRYPLQAQVGGIAMLVGYDIDRSNVEPGDVLRLTLYWQPLTHVEQNYNVFTHLLDSQNRIWGQQDSAPCGGACETTSWLEGEFIADSYTIAIKPDAPTGEYQIGVGMYDPTTMQRLPALDGAGARWRDDCIMLPARVTVGYAGD